MSADAEVLRLPEGSILVLRGVELGEGLDAALVEQLTDTVGHRRFLVLHIPADATALVWGPDDDLVAKVQALLVPPVEPLATCPWCGTEYHRGPHGYLEIPAELLASPAPAGDRPELHSCAGGVIVVPG